VVTIALASCPATAPTDPFEISVGREIQRRCVGAAPCRLRLTAATSFPWDTLYVFPYTMNRIEIEAVLGRPTSDYIEFSKKLVFVSNGEIVHEETTPVSVEHPMDGEILFGDPSDPLTYERVSANEVFTVDRVSSATAEYFVLKREAPYAGRRRELH